MKKFLLSLILGAVATSMSADINGSGYYRVRNYGSLRWASLIDDKGSVDFVASTADLHALQLWSDTEGTLADPASIIYLDNVSGTEYNVSAQGTSLRELVDHPINIGAPAEGEDGQTVYRIWGTYGNYTKYIADGETRLDREYGVATINDPANTKFKQWYFLPIDVNSDNYYGTVPTVFTTDGGYYTSLYTSFPYKPYSKNVKAYYIDRVGYGMAEMVEITQGVPPGAPVIIQCAGTNVADNKMELLSSLPALPDNALTGVYFDYKYISVSNQVPYDPETMRVLGVCSDGSLGFVIGNLEVIPANSAYLSVPPGSVPELKCVNTETFNSNIPSEPQLIYFGDYGMLEPDGEGNYSGYFEIPAIEGDDNNLYIKLSTSTEGSSKVVIGPYASGNQNLFLGPGIPMATPFSFNSANYWVIPEWMGGDLSITLNFQYQSAIFFSSTGASVKTVSADNTTIKYDGISIWSESGAEIKVFDINGKYIAGSKGFAVDASTLSKGVYIIVSEGKSLKIVR